MLEGIWRAKPSSGSLKNIIGIRGCAGPMAILIFEPIAFSVRVKRTGFRSIGGQRNRRYNDDGGVK